MNPPVPVVTRPSRNFFGARAPGAAAARPSLRPLFSERRRSSVNNSGAKRRRESTPSRPRFENRIGRLQRQITPCASGAVGSRTSHRRERIRLQRGNLLHCVFDLSLPFIYRYARDPLSQLIDSVPPRRLTHGVGERGRRAARCRRLVGTREFVGGGEEQIAPRHEGRARLRAPGRRRSFWMRFLDPSASQKCETGRARTRTRYGLRTGSSGRPLSKMAANHRGRKRENECLIVP